MISKKYGAFWLPQSTGISSDIPPPKHIFGSDFSMKSCAVGIKKGICLTEDGKVYEKGLTKEEIKDQPVEIFVQTSIKAIACNDMIGMIISNQGEVFIWGEDCRQSGLFVEPGLYSSEIPIKIPKLEEITQGSIGKTHAAVIDSMGHLFTWGSGSQGELGTLGFTINNQPPMIVESAKIFKAKQVLCGPSFTCICTDGCYVYLYGVIGSAHNYINSRRSSIVRRLPMGSPKKSSGNYPYTLPELEKYSITAVSCGNNFITALTDSGEAYIFDDCMDLVKLPINYGDCLTSVASTLDFAYGFSRSSSCIYEWREKFQNRLSSSTDFMECQLTYWIGKVYAVDNEYNNRISLVSTCSHMAGLLYEAEELGKHQLARYLTEIAPYKRSEYANKLIGSVFDSLDYKMDKNSSLRSSLRGSIDLTITQGHEDLERLYPKGDNDKTIERIIQCRIEHDRKERLSKSISPLVYPVIKYCFMQIKEFAGIKYMYEKTLGAALIPGIVGKLYHRFKIGSEAFAFQAIKRFSNFHMYNENNISSINDPRIKEASRGILQEISALIYKYKRLAFTIVLMHSIEKMPLKRHSIVSVNVNQLSVFPDLHLQLSELDEEKLDFISPSQTDGFILDLPGEKRSQPVELEEAEISRPSSTTLTRHSPSTEQVNKSPEAEPLNDTSRSNLYANHSSQQSFDSSSYQQKLIQNMISKPKIYREKDKDKALNSGRPPWKPSSKSPAIAPVHKAVVSPTNKRQQYDSELKERMRFIVKKKSAFITPNSERLGNIPPQYFLEFPDSVPTDSAPTDSEPSPCRDVKNCVFDPEMSFETKPEEDKRVKLSYQKLIKYRKGISAIEKAVSKSLSKTMSESLEKIKLQEKTKNKGRETKSKARDIPWQHRLYLVASDNLLRVMRKIYKKAFVARLKKYR